MDKVYRLKKNKLTGMWVAVQEIARSHTVGQSVAGALIGGVLRLSALAGLIFGLFHSAQAVPTGEVVQSGSTSISRGEAMPTVTIGSAKTIVDWTSFFIDPNELVKTNQPGALSAILNRVMGSAPSRLLEVLESNTNRLRHSLH